MIDIFNNNKQQVSSWLESLSQALQIDLTLDEEGICPLQVGEDQIIAIEVSREFEMVYLYTPFAEMPKEDPETAMMLMSRALELNAFQAETRGGAIGLIPRSQMFVYSLAIPIQGTDADAFANAILLFRDTAIELKSQLIDMSLAPHNTHTKQNIIKP